MPSSQVVTPVSPSHPNWFSPLPNDPQERAMLEDWFQYDLLETFKRYLPSKALCKTDTKLDEAFDDFLIMVAERLGQRLFCCYVVRQRLTQWQDVHPKGYHLCRKFYAALSRNLEVGRDKKKGTLTAQDYSAKETLKKELEALQRQLRPRASTIHRQSWADLENELIRNVGAYPALFQNRLSLQQFFDKHQDQLQGFSTGSTTPTSICP